MTAPLTAVVARVLLHCSERPGSRLGLHYTSRPGDGVGHNVVIDERAAEHLAAEITRAVAGDEGLRAASVRELRNVNENDFNWRAVGVEPAFGALSDATFDALTTDREDES